MSSSSGTTPSWAPFPGLSLLWTRLHGAPHRSLVPDALSLYLSFPISPYMCVVFQAHRLKNHESALYKNLHSFSTAARLLVTGTPLQVVPLFWCIGVMVPRASVAPATALYQCLYHTSVDQYLIAEYFNHLSDDGARAFCPGVQDPCNPRST